MWLLCRWGMFGAKRVVVCMWECDGVAMSDVVALREAKCLSAGCCCHLACCWMVAGALYRWVDQKAVLFSCCRCVD
jgi:hypothetical protein